MPRRSSYAALLSTLTLVGAGLVATASPAQAAPPPNDNFAAATTIGYGTFTTDNTEATLQAGEPQPSCTFEDPETGLGDAESSVWYRFTAPASGTVEMHTRDSESTDTVLAAYTGGSLGTLAEAACSEDISGSNLRSELTFTASAGQQFYVQLGTWTDGSTHATGGLTLSVSAVVPPGVPVNDNFVDALPIGYETVDTDNTLATMEPGEPQPSCTFEQSGVGDAESSVWYRFTAPATGAVTMHTRLSEAADTEIAVYTGSSLAGLTEVACSEDLAPTELRSELVLAAEAGTVYRVQVTTWTDEAEGHSQGPITLVVAPGEPVTGPPNDFIGQAEEIGPGVTTGNTIDATTEETDAVVADMSGCPLEHTIWYLYTPTSAGSAAADLAGSDFDTAMTIIEADDMGNVTDIACNDDNGMSQTSRLDLQVEPGLRYYIQVGSMAGQQGNVVLDLQGPGGGGDGGDPAVSGKAAKAPGTQIAYDLEVTNTGDVFDGGILSIDPPTGVKVVDVSSEHMGCSSTAPFTCDVMFMLPEDVFTVTVLVTPKHEGPFRLDAELEPFSSMPRARGARGSFASAAALADDPANNSVSVTASRAVVCDNKATSKANTAKGTAAADILCGLGGGDTLKGLGGNDLIFGGDGGDSLLGAAGKDKLYGAGGPDNIVGGAGSDVIDGGAGKDRCRETSDTRTSCER